MIPTESIVIIMRSMQAFLIRRLAMKRRNIYETDCVIVQRCEKQSPSRYPTTQSQNRMMRSHHPCLPDRVSRNCDFSSTAFSLGWN